MSPTELNPVIQTCLQTNNYSNYLQEKVRGAENQQSVKQRFVNWKWLLLILAISIPFLSFFNSSYPKVSLDKYFEAQEEDFYLSFRVMVEDCIKYNQPKTFMLLYSDDTVTTLNSMLTKLTDSAVCELTGCSSDHLVLEGNSFVNHDISYDYGNIITENADKLIEKGVMVIKNLEKIPGRLAMVFHSLCDQYQPVVPKSLFIFTIKMESYPKDKTEYVEKLLRNKWMDLSDDIFYPLFTRITNMIFIVQNENIA